MVSMTRCRVKNEFTAPAATQLLITYYRQRATAGLILTEGTWISKQAIGYVNVPGIFTREQVKGWQLVTEAVHLEGGKIFLQLGHAGANKARLLLEVVEEVSSVWGSQRVSVRINPLLSYSGRVDAPEATLPTYAYVAGKLNKKL